MTRLRVAVALLLFVGSFGAASPRALAKDPTDAPAALLEKIANASDETYRARKLVVLLGDSEKSAVLDVRSSEDGRYVRAQSGKDVTQTSAPSDGRRQVGVRPDRMVTKFRIVAEAPERVLGVELIPLRLLRRTDGALVERWWVHRSGVVYRRELFDGSGKMIGLTAMIDMDWGKPDAPDAVDVSRGGRLAVRDAPLRGEAPNSLGAGYELWGNYDLEIDGRPADQWVYSDGLHALSVFRMPGPLRVPEGFVAADVGGKRIFEGPGPGTWTWEGGGYGWVIIAEEPALEARDLLERLPTGGQSTWARLGSVWARIGRGLSSLVD